MKWLGQYIQSLAARFRNDVYLEDISTGTIASGGNLGLDSNNKIVKAAEVGSSVDLTSEVTGVLPSANLDADTMHLSVAQTVTSLKTYTANMRIGGATSTSANWISLDAQNGDDTSGAGITFYETGTYSVSAPQYGGKIVYNEDDDEFNIGTMQNDVFLKQISIDRGNAITRINHVLYVQSDTIAPIIYFFNEDTSIAEDQELARIVVKDADDEGIVSRINWVATEDHASGANGGTKIDFLTTAKGVSTEHTPVTIGGDTSINVVNDYHATTFETQITADDVGGGKILKYSPGNDDTLAGSEIFFLHTDGTWDQAEAGTVANGAYQMLGVGLGGSAQTVGVLTEGFIRIASTEILNTPGSGAVDGLPLYVSTTGGHFDFTAPSATGDYVRIVGYAIDDHSGSVLVYFNPDKTWVEVA